MPLSTSQKLRYARHLVLKEIGEKGQEVLLSSKVLVIGAGGLASSAIAHLASAGVGTIGIADGDIVELSNLQRQFLHTFAALHTNKAISAGEFVRARDRDINVHLHPLFVDEHNICDLISGYDFVLDCVDRFETKFLINDACVLMKKPYSHAGAVRFQGQAMTYVPDKGPCLRCLLQTAPNGATCQSVGVLGAAVGVLGSVQALETVKFLLNIGRLLTGRVFYFDGLSFETKVVPFSGRDPDCAVCGEHPRIKDLSENAKEYHAACENVQGDTKQ